jgi:hypothetical protein
MAYEPTKDRPRFHGESYEYRDPSRKIPQGHIAKQRGFSTTIPNPYVKEDLLPLYESGLGYDEIARRAGALGISNIDKEREVSDILAYQEAAEEAVDSPPMNDVVVVEDPQFPMDPIAGGDTGVNLFGDPTREGAFAGSYFDYLGGGLGDTSDPGNYFMQGAPGPIGLARAYIPPRVERPVPLGRDSFLYPQVTEDADGEPIPVRDQIGYEEDFIANEATKALQQLIGGFYSA